MKPRLLLLALLPAGVALYLWSGLELEVGTLRRVVRDAGLFGPAVFVLLFVLQAFGVPGFIFILTAVALWPPWEAILWLWLGALVAGTTGFLYARYIGREWIAERLPERMRRFEARVVEHGVRTVIGFRLAFFLLAPSHWALGLSPVSFRAMLLGSALGFLPWVVGVTLVGGQAAGWLAEQPPVLWLLLAAGFLLGTLLWAYRGRRRSSQ